jgi:hypothetical protein
VIIGKLIPAATRLKRYRRIEIEPSEPLPLGTDDVGLLDHDDLAAELRLADGESLTGSWGGIEPDLSDLEDLGNGCSRPGSPRSSLTSIYGPTTATTDNRLALAAGGEKAPPAPAIKNARWPCARARSAFIC